MWTQVLSPAWAGCPVNAYCPPMLSLVSILGHQRAAEERQVVKIGCLERGLSAAGTNDKPLQEKRNGRSDQYHDAGRI